MVGDENQRTMYQEQLDTEALSTSIVALTKIEELEKHTERQYDQLRASQKELKMDMKSDNEKVITAISSVHKRVDSLFKYGITIGGFLIMLMISIIGYLLINGRPWPH